MFSCQCSLQTNPFEPGIREYLLHPLSLEDMRRTVEAALQRRWAEERYGSLGIRMDCREGMAFLITV